MQIDTWVVWANTQLDVAIDNWLPFLFGSRPYAHAAACVPAAQVSN